MPDVSLSPEGLDWATYFARYRESLNRPQEPQEDDEEEPVTLERAAPLVDPQKAPGAPGRLAKRLIDAGYEVSVQRSRARVPATRYKSATGGGAESGTTDGGRSVGDVYRPPHDLERLLLIGVKRAGGKAVALQVSWKRKTTHLGEIETQIGDRVVSALWVKVDSPAFQIAETYDPVLGHEVRQGMRAPRRPNIYEIENEVEPPASLEKWLSIFAPKPEPKRRGK